MTYKLRATYTKKIVVNDEQLNGEPASRHKDVVFR